MSYKPSDRVRGEAEEELNLNLNPMMDMFAVLIPALLMMSTVVEVSIIAVSAPSIGGSSSDEKPKDDQPPLNLKVTINDTGYLVTSSVGPAPGSGLTEQKGPTFPIVDKTVVCSRYRGTRPPPRTKNLDRQMCDMQHPLDRKPFLVYDTAALAARALEFKKAFPHEYRIIIEAGSSVEYESVVDVMDATRSYVEGNGDVRPLFDEVVVSPGVM